MDLKNNNYFACDEHVDLAMDEYISENETFPELINNCNNKCGYCDNKSQYEVK